MSGAIPKAVVVGAGIGGLAAAIAAADAGYNVEVLERAEEFSPIGAGLSLWPNAVKALRELGAAGWIEEGRTTFGDAGIRRARDGSLIAATSPEKIRARYGEPLVLAHRSHLQAALLERLGRDRVRWGSAVRSVSPDGGVRLLSGDALAADAVIGADGIDSVVRPFLGGKNEPKDSGIVAYRSVVEWDREAPAGEYWGRGEVFGVAPLADGSVYWYAAFREDSEDDEPAKAQLARLVDRYRRWATPIPALIESTPPLTLLRHPLRDRTPDSHWGTGKATLLGDAAHPMLPFLGQGACSALEDAVALGFALRSEPDSERALRDYERERVKRARMLVKRSRSASKVALQSQPVLCAIRDRVLAATPDSMRLRQLDQVVGRD